MFNATAHPNARRRPQAALITVLVALTALGGCGGGGSGTTDTASSAKVSAITPDRVSYGRLSTFTVTGTDLSSGVTYAATGCDTVTVLPGGSATQQQVTCTPNKTMSVRLAASNAAGELLAVTLAVPKPEVTLTTTMGVIVVQLEPAVVQLTVDNFLQYVNASFYNGTLMHRAVPDFVVQGGGYTAVSGSTLTAQTGLRAAIALESNKGLSNTRGTIAMARGTDANTATSQFYFNKTNNAATLDYLNASSPGYAVFGTVLSGMAVVDAMSDVTTRTVGVFQNVPSTNIVVQTAAQTK